MVPARLAPGPVSGRAAPRRLLLSLLVVAALSWPTLARAQGTIPELREPVTDLADVLTATERSEVTGAIGEVGSDTGVDLFVLYVDTTGGQPAPDFATAVAERSSLGGNDALFVVAFEDRSYAIWVGGALDEVTDDEIDAILADVVEPRLVDGDPAGAAIFAARALGEAAGPPVETAAPTAAPTATPSAPPAGGGGTGGGGTGGGGIDLTAILAIGVIVAGALIVARVVLARRAEVAATAEERDRLAREANRALLAGDELLRDAEEELGFAEAQWGEAETRPLRDALGAAKAEVRASFAIRQRLDDAEPETPAQREAMLREMLARMSAARASLDAQLERIEALRDLQRTAPEQLAALPASIEAMRDRHAAAGTLLARLEDDYVPSALAPVSGNLAEAGKCLATATEEGGRGRAVVASDPSAGVVALRRAQEAIAAAAALLDAIERLGGDLDDAASRLGPELGEAEADIRRARDLAAAEAGPGAGAGPDHDARVAEAERLLAAARAGASAQRLDPLVVLEAATAAHRAADAALAGLQEAARARQRQAAILASTITTARGRVDRAIGYITTRRHGVGERARTRAAEAEARLREAESLAPTDPGAAIETAQHAARLADEALGLASREFDAWDDRRGPVAGPYRHPPGAGGDVMGAVLGGIIGGILAGGMRGGRGSGWGGSSWGGGRSRGGGFGMPRGPMGGGGRSRGGGFGGGGGGGRARGGRW